jgi:hypothetical protein
MYIYLYICVVRARVCVCVCVDKYVFMNPNSVGSVFYFQNMNLKIFLT